MAARNEVDLRPLLTPAVAAVGYELDDVVVTPIGRRSLVRVTVDGDDGVDLDAIGVVSRAVADALDTSDTAFGATGAGAPYTLEVSSPGVDRPLTEPRHWRRARGRLIRVTAAGSPVTGRIVDTSGSSVVLEIDGVPREFDFGDLGAGRIEVEFQHRSDPRQESGFADPTSSDGTSPSRPGKE